MHLNICAKSQIVNRMNCRTNKHGQIQEYLGKTSQAQLDNLIEEQVRQSATKFIQQQNSDLSVLDEDMTADYEQELIQHFYVHAGEANLKALELLKNLNGSQLRSDV